MEGFPVALEKGVKDIAKELNVPYSEYTHMGANNRLLIFRETNKIVKRLDFTWMKDYVSVTLYIDKYLFWPNIRCLSQIEWKRLEELPLDGTESFYKEKVSTFVDCLKKSRIGIVLE